MALPVLLALAPICFLLHFLVETHQRGIATARNEISGAPVIEAISRIRHAVIEEALGGHQPLSRTIVKAERATVMRALDYWPKSAELRTRTGLVLIAIDSYIAGGALTPDSVSSILHDLNALYPVVANASELILDPDLDTYYLMDLIVNRLPDLAATAWQLHRISAEAAQSPLTAAIARARSAGYLALLREQAQAVKESFAFARTHQRDGGLAQALDPAIGRFKAAVDLISPEDPGSMTFEADVLAELLFAARGVEQVVKSELVRLLAMRIDSFQARRNQEILFAIALIVVVAVVMLVWLSVSIVRPVRHITRQMGRLAAGELQQTIDGGGRRDEIGEMVKAINIFRDTAVARIQLENQAAASANLLFENMSVLERAERVAQLGNWRYDIHAQSLSWSKSMYELTGFDPADGLPSLEVIAQCVNPADLLRLVGSLERIRPKAAVVSADVRTTHPWLGVRHMRLSIEVDFDSRNIPQALFGTVQDVTELKDGQLALEAKTAALAEAQAIGRIGNWSWRFGASDIHWSDEIYVIMGYDTASFTPSVDKVRALYAEGTIADLSAAQRRVMAGGGTESVDVRALREDGLIADVMVVTKAEMDDAGNIIGFVGTIQDISERKKAERDLEKLAYYDPLTGFANRALFQRSFRRYIRNAVDDNCQAALFLLDLDKFKEVNDSLGHAAGDELLVIAAERLKRGLPQNAFLSRLGGDEFAIILPDTNIAVAEAVGDKVIDLLSAAVHLKQGEVSVGVSIGCVIIPRDGEEAVDLLRKADLALYRAKDDGRNRMQVFMPELSEILQEKSRLARDLRKALEANEDLELHYQPQFNARTGSVTGFEALVRWKHPERGYVSPAEFVPIAESAALICDLGLWVLAEGCRQTKAWLDAGQPERDISVNVSASQLWQSEFESDVRRILAETGLPPHLLTLEVTESVFVKEGEGRVARILGNLRSLGVTLALDDFGTGYSSLGYLNQLPFQKLKIDRVFVDGVDASPKRLRLLRGIVELGRGLDMTLVAEGAERPEEVNALLQMGCDHIQGYVFAKPLPAAAVIAVSNDLEATWHRRRAA